MGGAERAERRRKQQQAAAKGVVTSARASTTDRNKIITAVVVLIVIAAVIIGGVLWQRARSTPPDSVPVARVTADYPVTLDNAVVVAGQSSADVTVDIYEDPLCPACGTFEARDASKIEEALAAGDIKVRYHLVNLLDAQSDPPGYSLTAAAATLCAAEADQFPSYHASLFRTQPREGGQGYTTDQLVQLGRDLGITTDTFATCVRQGTHQEAIRAQLDSARNNPALKRPANGGQYFATPTVVIDNTIVDLNNQSWLDDAR